MSRDNGDTYLYRKGSSPNTRVAISQKNRVFSHPYSSSIQSQKQVGVISNFQHSETRALDPVYGVGFGDKIMEMVPGMTQPMSVTLNRTLLYTAGIVQEVGYAGGVDGLVRSLRQHKWPFDLRSELVFSELVSVRDNGDINPKAVSMATDEKNRLALITLFEACWFSNLSADFQSGTAMVSENSTVMCTDVTDGTSHYGNGPENYGDLLESGNNPIFQKGSGSRVFTGF